MAVSIAILENNIAYPRLLAAYRPVRTRTRGDEARPPRPLSYRSSRRRAKRATRYPPTQLPRPTRCGLLWLADKVSYWRFCCRGKNSTVAAADGRGEPAALRVRAP